VSEIASGFNFLTENSLKGMQSDALRRPVNDLALKYDSAV